MPDRSSDLAEIARSLNVDAVALAPGSNFTRAVVGQSFTSHERPFLLVVRGNRAAMRPGMAWTCEPGLYRSGDIGVRVKDDVLITDTGCRTLTTFPKDLTVVGT